VQGINISGTKFRKSLFYCRREDIICSGGSTGDWWQLTKCRNYVCVNLC